jgi:hypothetical protein
LIAKAGSHPEAIFDGTTPIGTEGVPDGTLKGDRCTGSYVDVRRIALVIDFLNNSCSFVSVINVTRVIFGHTQGIE